MCASLDRPKYNCEPQVIHGTVVPQSSREEAAAASTMVTTESPLVPVESSFHFEVQLKQKTHCQRGSCCSPKSMRKRGMITQAEASADSTLALWGANHALNKSWWLKISPV